MSPACTTKTTLQTSTCLSPATRCKVQQPVLSRKLTWEFACWEQSSAATVQTRRLPTDENPNVREGERRMARADREYCRRHSFEALHHQQRQFQEAGCTSSLGSERLLQAKTARVATQTTSQVNARFYTLDRTSQPSTTKDKQFTFANSQPNQHQNSKRNAKS